MVPAGQGGEEEFKKAVIAMESHILNRGFKPLFKKVPEREHGKLLAVLPAGSRTEYDRDNSDYVYKTENLINLQGKKYHGKRNHINKFLKKYSYEYVEMEQWNLDECKNIMERWCAGRECSCRRGEYCERYANQEVLDNFKQLRCKGALIKVDGEFRAFTVGEMLNCDTVVIHIEKADFNTHGLYSFINKEFCAREWSGTKYINREQDLGQEGIRKAKLSYYPDHMERKFTVYPNIV